MLPLLLATRNAGKIQELQALLRGLPVRLVPAAQWEAEFRVAETGSSYAENASLKAVAYARASGMWSLADDTGLEVDALDGAPGLRSARLVGEVGDDAARRARLLQLLAPLPRPWSARFRCVVALAGPAGSLDLAEGTCEGEILPVERGSQGFGYDPLFLLAACGSTMAELALEEKNRLSHRAAAVRALLPRLKQRLGIE